MYMCDSFTLFFRLHFHIHIIIIISPPPPQLLTRLLSSLLVYSLSSLFTSVLDSATASAAAACGGCGCHQSTSCAHQHNLFR